MFLDEVVVANVYLQAAWLIILYRVYCDLDTGKYALVDLDGY